MNVRTLCLAILNFGDATGYEIKKLSSEGRFSYFIDVSYGSIYPTLARMEQDGLVTCRAQSQHGKPDRKVYSITQRGRAEFVKALAVPPQPDKFKSEFLLVALSAEMTTGQVLADAIDTRLADLTAQLAMFDEALSDCDHPASRWIINYARHVKAAEIAYLQSNRRQLIELAGSSLVVDAAE